jgi:hypothetical protein
VSVTLSATDRSGVASTVYTADGTDPTLDGGTGSAYTGPFTLSSTTTVEYSSTDDAGNVEAAKSQLIQIDTTPPMTTASCNGAACVAWYDATVSLTLNASDNADGSGVWQTVYTLDGSLPSFLNGHLYNGAITINQTTTINFLSWDLAGNQEQMESVTISINTVPPSASINCNSAQGVCSSGWYTKPVSVYLNYQGSGAPMGGLKYTTDGTTPGPDAGLLYNGQFLVGQITTVTWTAFDVAGNYEAVQTQTLYVDTQAPTGVAISSPVDGGTITGKAAYIVPASSATDNVGIWSYTYYRDCAIDGGVRLGSRVNTPSRWSWYWDAGGGLPAGPHSLCIRAADDAGNSTLSSSIVVTVP